METELMGSLTRVDLSFLPNSTLLDNSEPTPLPDQAQNSVLGMPVIPAEEIEASTASMIEIREASPTKQQQQQQHETKEKDTIPDTIEEAGDEIVQVKTTTTKSTNRRRAWLWSTIESEDDFIKLVEEFRRQGFPLGLATEVCTDKMEAPVRLWIVDNNQSLEQYKDQHVLRYRTEDATVQLAPCTRWAELMETLESHALLADLMKVNGNFWLIRYVVSYGRF